MNKTISSSSPTNNTFHYCFTVFEDVINVSPTARHVISSSYLAVSAVNCFFNMANVFLMHQTKIAKKSQSVRLFFILSLYDIAYNALSNPAFSLLIWYNEKLTCLSKRLILVVGHFASYASCYMVCLIGFDRYLHIKYLNYYSTVFSPSRFRLALWVHFFFTCWQCTASVAGPVILGHNGGSILSSPTNVLIFLFTAFAYFLSIDKLKEHQQAQAMSSKQRDIVRIASIHLVISFVFYGTFVLTQVINYSLSGILGKRITPFFYHVAMQFVSISTSVNAITFMAINVKIKRRLKDIFGIESTNNVEAARGGGSMKTTVTNNHTKSLPRSLRCAKDETTMGRFDTASGELRTEDTSVCG